MKVTVEQIDGKPHTVVWHATWGDGLLPRGRNWVPSPQGYVYVMELPPEIAPHICAIALPPLPRNPTLEDVSLYEAHGISPVWKGRVFTEGKTYEYVENQSLKDGFGAIDKTVTHAMHNGERVEIAIKEPTK